MKPSVIAVGLAGAMALALIFGWLDGYKNLPAYGAVMVTLFLFSLFRTFKHGDAEENL